MTPYDTFWMNLRAEASPYWSANGGPIVQTVDFLTKPSIIELQKRRMRFLIDRYGNTGTIFAWEIMNEIDIWWHASPEQIRKWVDDMAIYVRQYEKERWGRNHMVTVSQADPLPKGLNADTAFNDPHLDFATMHLYLGASRGPKPGQEEQAGVDFASGVTYARHMVKDNRPVLDGESGPIDKWIADPSVDDEVFRQMSWQHLMAGGAGPGTRWPYRNPHHVTPGMLDELKAIRTFCDKVSWPALTGPEVEIKSTVPQSGKATIFGTNKGAIAWLRATTNTAGKQFALYWPGLAKPAKIHLFDVKSGKWLPTVLSSQDKDGIRIPMPAGLREVAVWIER
jgi:mannan endo-1,4-beta-mannosidase